jgi:hypothetical protein
MRIARSCQHEPPVPDETSCRAALRKLSTRADPRKFRQPRPTPFDVTERMHEFGVSGDLGQVLAFLRSFGVRIRDANQLPNRPEAFQTERSLAFSPPALPAPLALPEPRQPGQNESAPPISPPAAPARPALPYSPAVGHIAGALPPHPDDEPVGAAVPSAVEAYVPQPDNVTGWVGGASTGPLASPVAGVPASVAKDESG